MPGRPRPLAVFLALTTTFVLWLSFGQAWWQAIIDPDLFWQLWAGDRMLELEFPRANTFSWTAPESPWTLHAPLVALIYAAVGLDWVWLLRGLVVSGTAMLLVGLAWRPGKAWATVFTLLWCLVLVHYGRSARALSWGNLLLALHTFLLYRTDERWRWRLPLATALVAFWSWFHGSFVVGLWMLMLTRWRWGLVALVLTALNPSGLDLYRLILGYGTGAEGKVFVYNAIEEWLPVSFDLHGGLRLVCLALIVWFVVKDRAWREGLLLLPLGALALRALRFFDVVGIALAPTMADSLARRTPERRMLNPLPMLAVALLTTIVAAPRPEVDADRFPEPLVATLKQQGAMRLWHPHHLGGWLAYHGILCFWDPRNDCYPADVLDAGLKIQRQEVGWYEALKRWKVDTVLTDDPTLQQALRKRGWRVVGRHRAHLLLRSPGA
jgi:hypothetical protein